jgi:osmoprotectant transport system permease protein
VFRIGELFDWLTDAENWTGRYGLANLFVEHLTLTLVSLAIAGLLAIPIGVAIGQSGRGETLVIAISSASRAIPTMGLMFALVMVMGVEFRQFAVVLALVGIAIPPVLAGAYAGIKAIPIVIREGARAQGMTTLQQIRHVGLPLSASSIAGGFKIAYLQVVSTVVLAPLVGLGGLGFGVIQGLALRDFAQLTGSAVVIVLLSITGERLLAKAQGKLDRRLTQSKINR